MVDEKGNRIVFGSITDSYALERFARDLCVLMGCHVEIARSGDDAARKSKRIGGAHTLSLAKQLGDAVRRRARAEKRHDVDAVLAVTGGSELFAGKLVDVQRRTIGGFARGELIVEGLGAYRGEWLHIAFQNENLIAWRATRTIAVRSSPACRT